jgi:hypothetical protein
MAKQVMDQFSSVDAWQAGLVTLASRWSRYFSFFSSSNGAGGAMV